MKVFRNIVVEIVSLMIAATILYKHICRMMGKEVQFEASLNNLHLFLLITGWIVVVLLIVALFDMINDPTKKTPDQLRAQIIKPGWNTISKFISGTFILAYVFVGAWGFVILNSALLLNIVMLSELGKEGLKQLEKQGVKIEEPSLKGKPLSRYKIMLRKPK